MSTWLKASFVGLSFSILAAPALAHADVNLSVKEGTVTYHIVHKFHKVTGVSKKVEGRVRLKSDGPTQVAIRVPVESFDSGNVNRDAHMKETVDAAQFPNVDLKAAADGIAMPANFPATVQKTFHAQITLHGVSQTQEIPVTIQFEAADRIVATTSFSVSLDSFKVERPSLLFVKIDDEMKVDATIKLAP